MGTNKTQYYKNTQTYKPKEVSNTQTKQKQTKKKKTNKKNLNLEI
jgi:predicted transcriptional regulator